MGEYPLAKLCGAMLSRPRPTDSGEEQLTYIIDPIADAGLCASPLNSIKHWEANRHQSLIYKGFTLFLYLK